jgi:hypothetical protein
MYAKPLKYVGIFLAGICFILMLTNPSMSAFKERVGANSYKTTYRLNNFFVCSIYYDGQYKYVGVLGNFFKMS